MVNTPLASVLSNKKDSNMLLFFSYIFLTGVGFPLLRYVSLNFDIINNNAVRFLSGGCLFLILVLVQYRHEVKTLFSSRLIIFQLLLVALLMTGNMYFFMNAMQLTSALTGSIFCILGLPVTTTLAAFFYIDERKKAKQSRFILSSLLAIIGSAIFVGTTEQIALGNNFTLGAFYWIITITIAAVQNILVKQIAQKIHTLVISTVTALITGALFLGYAIISDKIDSFFAKPDYLILLLVVAGMYGLATGMYMAFHIIQKKGVITFNILQMMVPVSTAIVAYITLGETVSYLQLIGAAVVILGCYGALTTKMTPT